MLGVLEMTIDDCMEAFSLMMSKAFVQKHMSHFSLRGKVQARYSTTALEDCISKTIENVGMAGAKLRNGKDPRCKV